MDVSLPSHACYEHIAASSRCLDDTLLYFLILLIIQCIDPDGFLKTASKSAQSLVWEGNDEAGPPLVSRHILIYNLPGSLLA